MKVFCPILSKHDKGGGIKSTISLLNELSKLGINIVVMIPKDNNYQDKFEKTINIHFLNPESNISINHLIDFYKTSKHLNSFIKKENLQNEIILCSDRPALMTINFFSKNYKKIIYVSRGNDYINFSNRLLRHIVFPHIKTVVAISNHQLLIINKYLKKEINTCVIHNGINLPEKQMKPFKNPKVTLTVIGGICELKGQLQAIQLVEKLGSDYILKLFGSTFTNLDEMYKQDLLAYISKNNIKNVEFMGYNENLNDVFSQTDILISTSTSEGLGRTIIEGMAYGIPVIANQLAGAPTEIIEDRIDGYLYDGTLENLHSKLIKVINEKELTNSIINNALQKAHTKFSNEHMGKQYYSILKNLNEKN